MNLREQTNYDKRVTYRNNLKGAKGRLAIWNKINAIQNGNSLTEIYTTLKDLSSNFISPTEFRNSLIWLSAAIGKSVTISDAEMSRMEWVFSQKRMKNPEEVAEIVTKIRDNTEWNKPPLIMTFPKKIIIAGVTKPFSVATLAALVREKQWNYKQIWYNDSYVTDIQANEVFWDTLRVYTSAPLAWSKNKNYKNQKQLQERLIGDDAEIGIDAYLAIVLHHWQSPKSDTLMLTDWMRLNTVGSDGDPLVVGSVGSVVRLSSVNQVVLSNSGIGASSSLLSAS